MNISLSKNDVSYLISCIIIISLAVILWIKLSDIPDHLFWYLISIGFTIFLISEFSLADIVYKPVGDKGFTPKISVLIPVKNEEEVIYQTIETVVKSNYPKELLEIIAINDGSTDRTGEELERAKKDFNIKVISLEKNLGKRKAIATGFKEASGEIIVIIDSDTFLSPDALYNAVQYFIDEEVGAVCGQGRVYNKDKNILTRMQDAWYYGMFNVFKAFESVFGMVTCCSGILSLYRRKSIEGMIDYWANEKFLGLPVKVGDDRALTNIVLKPQIIQASDADDRLLTAYTAKRGWKVVYAKNAVAYTIVPENLKKFIKQQIRWKKGWFRGTLFALTFMWRKNPMGAFFYYLHTFLAFLTPVIVFRVFYLSIFNCDYKLALIYILGLAYVGFCYAIHQAVRDNSKCWIWRIPFQLSYNLFVSPILSVYAWFTINRESWMTR